MKQMMEKPPETLEELLTSPLLWVDSSGHIIILRQFIALSFTINLLISLLSADVQALTMKSAVMSTFKEV